MTQEDLRQRRGREGGIFWDKATHGHPLSHAGVYVLQSSPQSHYSHPLSHACVYVSPPFPDSERQRPLEPLEGLHPQQWPLPGNLHIPGPHLHEAHDRKLHGSRHGQPWWME